MITFGSVCSGIEGASVAWHPLGWRAAWVSEIEPFPCAVLKHHYPDVPNLGDMTLIPDLVAMGVADAPDVLVGGTPCQSFSLAGLRGGLTDTRGQLTFTFVKLANEIDIQRIENGKPECIVVFENVPGILSDKTNAFGCLLAGLCGEEQELVPSGKRWSDAGCVLGPQRKVAWRILDAQFQGLAQRRRRVFVVASARDGFDPVSVLLELDGVRRDTAPRRETGKGFTHSVAPCIGASGRGFERGGDTRGQDPVVAVTHALRGEGFDASEDGTGRGTPLVPVGITIHGTDKTARVASFTDVAGALRARTPGSQENSSTTAVMTPIAFDCKASGQSGFGVGEIASTMRSMGHSGSHQNGGGHQAVAFGIPGNWIGRAPENGGNATAPMDNIAPNLTSTDRHAVAAFKGGQGSAAGGIGYSEHVAPTLNSADSGSNRTPSVLVSETLYNKGIRQFGDSNGSTQETDTAAILSALQEKIGTETFAEWGLGILDSLQSPEILRRYLLLEESIRPTQFSRSWVVGCALSRSQARAERVLQSLREAGCEGRSPQGWRPSEQHLEQLGTYLSELSQPGTQAERFMHDLWIANEGFGVLQHALSTIQEIRRSPLGERQSIHRNSTRRCSEPNEDLRGSELPTEISREGLLRETRTTSGSGDARVSAENSQRECKTSMATGELQVRRLTVEECEFLQGFPRGYTNVSHRNKPAADGPRYKALGNSFAVPVVRWIGQRINDAIR